MCLECFIKVYLAGTIFVTCCHGVAPWIHLLHHGYIAVAYGIYDLFRTHTICPNHVATIFLVFISNRHISYIFRLINFFIKVTRCFTYWPNMLREQVVLFLIVCWKSTLISRYAYASSFTEINIGIITKKGSLALHHALLQRSVSIAKTCVHT